MSADIHILGFAGSLRKQSYNRAALRVARELTPEGMELESITLDDIPLFNQDIEGDNAPEAVQIFRKKIRQADGLLIMTPEYNYSISGVLKNAIDWASRPIGQSVLAGKPTAIMGVGGRFGTARAQLHLRQILVYTDTPTLVKPEVYIINAWEHFDAEGNLKDEATREHIRNLLEALLKWTRRMEYVRS
jgi:chromate reductase, NAD(P)H dehydrogenase (quinone)